MLYYVFKSTIHGFTILLFAVFQVSFDEGILQWKRVLELWVFLLIIFLDHLTSMFLCIQR